MMRGPRTMLSEAGSALSVRSVRLVDATAATSTPSIRDTTLPSRPVGNGSQRADTRTRGKRYSSRASCDVDPLRQRNGRVVTDRGNHEGAGGRVTGEGVVARPTSRGIRNRRHERTGRLAEAVDRDRREHAERAAGRHVAHVGGVDRHRRRERPGVSLGLGDPRARLNVGVERDGDGRQDADDRDDDHQLDEGEASLVRYRETLLGPPPNHWVPPYGFALHECHLFLAMTRCSFGATANRVSNDDFLTI